jgi:DNA primase
LIQEAFMARIAEEEIERLKKEISIQRLVEAHGVVLERRGGDLHGRCPLHKDQGPSLIVSLAKNLWHCLGACNTGGSVIDWVMKVRNVSFRHAVEILRETALPTSSTPDAAMAPLPPPVDMTASDRTLLRQVVGFYHKTLKTSPEALAYLKSRGITSPDIIDRYMLGFANRTLGLRLPEKNQKAGSTIRERLQNLGILRESGHEHFNGSLVIPVLGENDEVLEIYGRKITPKLRPGTPDHLYLKGPHRGVFNIQALERYDEIILCEALIDALTFLEAGFPNVTASFGVGGFTPDHWEALRRFKTKRVLIAYDRDDAGEKGALSLAAELMAAGIECFRIQFPRGMDANEYARKVLPATKSLGMAIRSALWMGKGPAVSSNTTETPAPIATPTPDSSASAVPVPPAVELAPAEPLASGGPAAAVAPTVTDSAPRALPASPQPPLPPPALPLEQRGKDLWIAFGDRQYRIRGLMDSGALKVDLMAIRGERFYQDKFDMALAKQRVAFMHPAAHELGVAEDVITKDLGHILRALEELQEKKQQAALEARSPAATLTPGQSAAALELLRDPRLMDRILEDFRRSGVVGEEVNLLVGYLAAVSRLLDRPMAVLIQSSSAAGKSSVMEAVLAFFPPEHYLKYSAMTGQSLFYMGGLDLKHKVIAVAEEEGAERASYALKLLQSEGELTIASTGKDPATGRHVTHEYHVEGPVMIFLTTTAVDLDEELLNRCVVLSVNEGREQTRMIHQLQRNQQTLQGQMARRDAGHIRALHQNAQRLLRPLMVVNNYAPSLTFRDDQTRSRRDHTKYLTLIQSVTLLHQYQRPTQTESYRGEAVEYIEVTREDIRIANRLAHEILGRTLDELPPGTRRLLLRLDAWVEEQCAALGLTRQEFRFQRSDVRALGWAHTQAREHLDKLVDFEYVIAHRGTRGQSFVYELAYEGQGQDGQAFVMGLIDPDRLPQGEPSKALTPAAPGYDGKLAGSEAQLAGSVEELAALWPPHGPALAAGWRAGLDGAQSAPEPVLGGELAETPKNTVPERAVAAPVPSHRNGNGAHKPKGEL